MVRTFLAKSTKPSFPLLVGIACVSNSELFSQNQYAHVLWSTLIDGKLLRSVYKYLKVVLLVMFTECGDLLRAFEASLESCSVAEGAGLVHFFSPSPLVLVPPVWSFSTPSFQALLVVARSCCTTYMAMAMVWGSSSPHFYGFQLDILVLVGDSTLFRRDAQTAMQVSMGKRRQLH